MPASKVAFKDKIKGIVGTNRNERILFVLWAAAFALAIFVRVFNITGDPLGLNIDEAAMGYDAWCLAHYGVDRYTIQMPVYLMNFGGGQSTLLAYMVAILCKICGGQINTLIIRIPGMVLNITGFFFGVYLLREAFGKYWALIGAYLLAVMPYFVMQGRFGLDCNLCVNMVTIAVGLTVIASKKEKLGWYIFAGIIWGLAYYSYAIGYIPNTVIVICVIAGLFYRDRSRLKKLIAMLVPIVLLGLPLAMMVFINTFDYPSFKLGFFTITRIPQYRSGDLSFDLMNIASNVGYVLQCILLADQFSYNSFVQHYVLYDISIPFVIIGFFAYVYNCFKEWGQKNVNWKQVWIIVFVIWFVMGCLIGNGTRPNVNRLNGIFFAQFFMLIYGLKWTYEFVRGLDLKKSRVLAARIVMLVVMMIYLVRSASFFNYYFRHYPIEHFPQAYFYGTFDDLLSDDGKIVGQTESKNGEEKKIYVDVEGGYYVFFFLSTLPNPFDTMIGIRGYDVVDNYYLGISGEISEDAGYLVFKSNTDKVDWLKSSGLETKSEGKYFMYME